MAIEIMFTRLTSLSQLMTVEKMRLPRVNMSKDPQNNLRIILLRKQLIWQYQEENFSRLTLSIQYWTVKIIATASTPTGTRQLQNMQVQTCSRQQEYLAAMSNTGSQKSLFSFIWKVGTSTFYLLLKVVYPYFQNSLTYLTTLAKLTAFITMEMKPEITMKKETWITNPAELKYGRQFRI